MARFSTVWGWVDGGAEVWPGLGLTEKIKNLVPWWTPRECNRTDLRVIPYYSPESIAVAQPNATSVTYLRVAPSDTLVSVSSTIFPVLGHCHLFPVSCLPSCAVSEFFSPSGNTFSFCPLVCTIASRNPVLIDRTLIDPTWHSSFAVFLLLASSYLHTS